MQLEIPGAMRCMRAFAKLSWVQDEIIRREFLQTIVPPRPRPTQKRGGGSNVGRALRITRWARERRWLTLLRGGRAV